MSTTKGITMCTALQAQHAPLLSPSQMAARSILGARGSRAHIDQRLWAIPAWRRKLDVLGHGIEVALWTLVAHLVSFHEFWPEKVVEMSQHVLLLFLLEEIIHYVSRFFVQLLR